MGVLKHGLDVHTMVHIASIFQPDKQNECAIVYLGWRDKETENPSGLVYLPLAVWQKLFCRVTQPSGGQCRTLPLFP